MRTIHIDKSTPENVKALKTIQKAQRLGICKGRMALPTARILIQMGYESLKRKAK